MATKKGQRIFIWVIAIVMTVGTVAGFIAMMIAPTNQKIDEAAQAKALAEYQQQAKAAQEAHAASSKPLDGYAPEAFDKATVPAMKVETIIQGDGTAAKADSTVTVNYFGWTSDGKIFDSTNQNGTVTPVDQSLAQVIKGWTEGLTGVKAGTTVKLTIPADKAYGDTDTGSGQPVGPLMFIIELKAVK